MLFSSASPRQRIVTLRAWVEKNSAAWPGRVAGADDVDVEAVGVRRLAARRAVGDALAREAVEARRSTAAATTTPQARMIVCARRTSPPSRCTWRVAASIRVDRARHEDLGAEPARLLQRAARQLVAGHARREAEVVLDPRRRAGLAAGRLALDHDRPQPLRRAVHGRGEARGPGADDDRVVLRGRGSVPRPSSSATRRSCGRTTVLPSRSRIAGRSASAAAARRPRRSSASGVVGREPLEADLVAVEEAPQLGAGAGPSGARPRSRAAGAGRRRFPAGRAGRSSDGRRAGRPPSPTSGATAAIAW